jgi:hydroxyethylthiazole kinase-like uncharacterized protein yjeF
VSQPSIESITQAWVADRLAPRPERAHKGDFGRLLVVAGSVEYPGAAMLTGLGAMRAGAGLVTVAAAASVTDRLAGGVPELTWMLLDEEAPGLIAPSGWRHVTSESAAYDAVVLGPGLGRQAATLRRTRNLVGVLRAPAVVDADALNALAAGARWWQGVKTQLVLTPHPGEFGRLVAGDAPPADDDAARGAAASEAALRWKQTVVLKGARSVIASPDGEVRRSSVATPALATAGSGDVLAGVIGALLAQVGSDVVRFRELGIDPDERWAAIAAMAASLHGRAGAAASGGAPLTAGRIAEAIPGIWDKVSGLSNQWPRQRNSHPHRLR